MDNSVIGRLHRNAVKQRLFRRFVRSAVQLHQDGSAKKAADIYFCVTYGGMTRKKAAETFGVSVERVRQVLHKGEMLKLMNTYQVCHPRGSCLIGAIQ